MRKYLQNKNQSSKKIMIEISQKTQMTKKEKKGKTCSELCYQKNGGPKPKP